MSSSRAQATSAVTNIARRSTTNWLTTWQAATCAGLRYWADAVERRATPLELASGSLRWLELVTRKGTPDWATPNRVVDASPITRLRDFSVARDTGVGPALILPPQAGHHSCIVDYNASQSQVRTALESGLTRAFVLEWLGATVETRNTSISDYLGSLQRAVAKIGEPVHLIGDCQGGWLATIYAALHPEDVATLTIGGAPVDFHAGDSAIADVARTAGMAPFELAVEARRRHALRCVPARRLHRPPARDGDLEAPRARAPPRRRRVRRTLSRVPELVRLDAGAPGVMYLWAVKHLFIGNELVRGTLAIEGRPVRLEAITCPVNLIGGTEDHITPPAQVFALADHVGTPPAEVASILTPGGHLGLFMGHEALRTSWQPVFARLAERGRAG